MPRSAGKSSSGKGAQRVGAGRLRGRKLLPLPGEYGGVRPTGARVRGAIFDRLQAHTPGAQVLDLFAGTGALAIEALSRGARAATCVELDRGVVAFLRRQMVDLGLGGQVEVVGADARAWLASGRGSRPRVDLALVDPPYAAAERYVAVLEALRHGDWLAPDAVVVCEWMPRATPGLRWPPGFVLEARREHGQTALDFLRPSGGEGTDQEANPP